MRTKRMITLLVAMMIGVLVNAQTEKNYSKSVELSGVDYISMMVMDYGSDLSDFFGINSQEKVMNEKIRIDKCSKGQDKIENCSSPIRRGAKPHPFFHKEPDTSVPNKKIH